MEKIDLEEIEASLGYLEDWKNVLNELRAAREVAEAARERLKIVYGDSLEAEQPCRMLQALQKLDESRRGYVE
jgi:hypothetical protein